MRRRDRTKGLTRAKGGKELGEGKLLAFDAHVSSEGVVVRGFSVTWSGDLSWNFSVFQMKIGVQGVDLTSRLR